MGGTIKLKIEGGPGPGFSRHLFSKSKTEWGDMGDWSGEFGADTDNMKRVILLRVEGQDSSSIVVHRGRHCLTAKTTYMLSPNGIRLNGDWPA